MTNFKLMTLIIAFTFVGTNYGWAQIDVKGKIKEKTNERANQKTDEGIDKGLDKIEEGVGNLFKKKDKKKKEEKPEETQPSESTETTKTVETPKTSPKMESYSKYDFIPGEKVIFFDDFSEAAVGDFPSAWNTNASGEVVTTNLFTGKWFNMKGNGSILLDEALNLTDNYTIEFDVIPTVGPEAGSAIEFGFYLYNALNPKDLQEGGAIPGTAGGVKMTFGYHSTYSAYIDGNYTISGNSDSPIMEVDKKYRLSFWVQKTRLRVYLNQEKIFDLPKIFANGFKANAMRFELWNTANPMITNFRVAAGLPDMRNKLLTDGKLVSYGVYFDVNKDVVKPESYGTLKGIADVLKENPTVRIKIVGHTDADGPDGANLDLSKRRGASVKASLIKDFGIDASRIESDGLGETKPIAPNDTPVNKSINRRVEFIKL